MKPKVDTEREIEDFPELPHYNAAMKLLPELHAWALDGFPGATLADLCRIASNHLPDQQSTAIRKRAEKNCRAILRSQGYRV